MPVPKMMRLLLRPLIVLVVSAPIIILLLAVQTGPIVSSADPLTGDEITRIEQLLLESAPSTPGVTSQQSLQLDVDELNLLLGYGLNLLELSPSWAAQFSIEAESLSSKMSVQILSGWLPLYLNMTGEFIEENSQLRLDQVVIGNVQIPDRLVAMGLDRLSNNLMQSTPVFSDVNDLLNNIETIEIAGSQMRIQLLWDPVLIGRISDDAQRLFISEEDRTRIINYYQSINEIATSIPTDIRAISLNELFIPLFTEAREYSINGNDPVAENRTLLQALAIYVNNEELEQLVGAELAADIPAAKFIEVRLLRRQDLAQHVVSIAAITASAGAEFAELLSTTKEAYDARYRSGFSFSDLTANTVGVTLAGYLTANNIMAMEMQRRLTQLQTETDYMPEVGNNRDGISETDFNAIYIDRNSVEYNQRLDEIQTIIDARPLFQGLQ
ncbi:MAG: hypothetical protein OXU30_06180 [Gammaproteobacteria bacterium]|nr:hypothetical protein [Gammaproteobacteria bacterium]